jgi:leishmanolysin-like peptidase
MHDITARHLLLSFIPDETTIAKKAVRRTTFPNGTFSYMVEFFVTPALMREGRKFYGCETFPGVPLEDASRKGTGGSHFEKRVFNNELMTGSMGSTGGIISSFTLALYEDSGWYKPNYEMAEPFRWGKNEGCSFTEEGCLSPETLALKPLFCSDLTQYPLYAVTRFLKMGNVFRELGGNSSCHYDRGSIGGCNSYNHTRELDPDIQYFSDPMVGGSNLLADSCPFKSGWISCKRPRDPHLSMNTFSETHGSHSKCVEFTIDTKWTRRNRTISPIHGGGCYEVFCDEASGPILAVLGKNFSCTKGKEIHIITNNLPDFSNAVTIVCPPCEDLCWDNLNACKSLLATPTVSTGLRVSNTIITIAAVLFSITSLMLVLAIGAAVIAGVLFWKWRKAINFYQKQ